MSPKNNSLGDDAKKKHRRDGKQNQRCPSIAAAIRI